MKTVLFGVLLGLVAAFPALAGQGAAPIASAGLWLAAQPLLWVFALGFAARPRLARHIYRRLR